MTLSLSAATLLILKVLVLVGLGLYTVFASIVVRQEQLMAHVLEETFEPVLRILTIAHFVAAVGVFLLAVVLL